MTLGRKQKDLDNRIQAKHVFSADDYLIADTWNYHSPGKHFYDKAYMDIIDFFCLHSPCKSRSWSPYCLEQFGWCKPWYSSRFRTKVSELISLSLDDNFYPIPNQYNFKQVWLEHCTQFGDFPFCSRPCAFVAEAGESNHYMNLFHRIRNSLAHGRFNIFRDHGEYYFNFEDVKTSNGITYVLARICLSKTQLAALRAFFCKW